MYKLSVIIYIVFYNVIWLCVLVDYFGDMESNWGDLVE